MTTMSVERYREHWDSWKPGPGPVAWRAAYHGHPEAAFAALCADAQAIGLQVSLDVGADKLGSEPLEYRLLGPLIVGVPERPQLLVVPFGRPGYPTSLHAAAVIAREKLAALAGGAPDA